MRLLNAKSRRQLQVFEEEEKVPGYAILSHTWGEATDEVKMQDLDDPDVQDKPGYTKIKYCCEQAELEGLEWVWIDTCCIDKTNPAELSEAINSMFRWYRAAKACYAYLVDVTDDALNLDGSRWFTRGWTLQELIAPSEVVFYSKNWHFIGTKRDMASSGSLLSEASGIDKRFLVEKFTFCDRERSPCIAQIMSWAAKRTTKKTEDMAYCLLGLFDVNIPLIYGEGRKAFYRLQEKLLKVSDDHTLFAWGTELQKELPMVALNTPYDPSCPTTGMLAPTPSEFLNSGCVRRKLFPCQPLGQNDLEQYIYPTLMAYRGVRIELPVIRAPSWLSKTDPDMGLPYTGPELAYDVVANEEIIFAVLACSIDSDPDHYLGVPLCPILNPDGDSTGDFRRLRMGTVLIPRNKSGLDSLRFAVLHIEALGEEEASL